jgi:quercetin dioxygenase-like cupin family protein
MNVTRFASAPQYFPPHHDGMRCVRLQGHEAGATDTVWIGVSQMEPGGGTSFDASPVEKLYVVLEGTVTLLSDGGEVELAQYDSCRLEPGEPRRLVNRTDRTAAILLVMPYTRAS